MPRADFREFVVPLDDPVVSRLHGFDAYSHPENMLRTFPGAQELLDKWEGLARAPYHGITADGEITPGLYRLEPNGAPVEAMVTAAEKVLALLSDEQREKVSYAVDASEFQIWHNGEPYFFRYGIRLEELEHPVREAILDLMRASMSERGFDKVHHAMWMNEFLGELTATTPVMNRWSYNFKLFGTPSAKEPWGWGFFGHHVIVNCVVVDGQLTMTPTFVGAEPNWAPHGPWANQVLLEDERELGLALMQSLPEDLRDRAQIYELMEDPAMPPDRVVPADQRHLAGAFQDNRVIPYEGVPASEFDEDQRKRLLELIAIFIELQPAGAQAQRMADIERHLDETYWSWIGPYDDDSVFYYRIQSPVIVAELDHHTGGFLGNVEPGRFHIHTIVRTPNGNDYGKELIRLHDARRGAIAKQQNSDSREN